MNTEGFPLKKAPRSRWLAAALLVFGAAGLNAAATAQDGPVEVSIKNRQGEEIGSATLSQEKGGVRLQLEVSGLTPGEHGVHIHGEGACETPRFKSAGPHFAPHDRSHGFLDSEGPHAGDLPVLEVNREGRAANYDYTVTRVALSGDSLKDGNGSALVIHAKPDDYLTDTGGGSGDRVACGVIAEGSGAPADPGGGQAERPAQASSYPDFAKADRSGDGKLNRGEAAAASLTVLMRTWQQADTNDNKVLSKMGDQG